MGASNSAAPARAARARAERLAHPDAFPTTAGVALPLGVALQAIGQDTSDTKYDEYSVVIDAMPLGLTAEQFLAEMAIDLNGAVSDDSFNAINEFRRRPPAQTTPAVGDIYDFNTAGPINRSVALIASGPSEFTFQTVTTSGMEEHPESGTRSFGFEVLSDGAIRFYTRGRSHLGRCTIRLAVAGAQNAAWTRLCHGISDSIAARGGAPRVGSFEMWIAHR